MVIFEVLEGFFTLGDLATFFELTDFLLLTLSTSFNLSPEVISLCLYSYHKDRRCIQSFYLLRRSTCFLAHEMVFKCNGYFRYRMTKYYNGSSISES